jgi:hypothetical protein
LKPLNNPRRITVSDLTATELKILNRLSEARNRTVHLGTKLQEVISILPGSATPVNAVNATGNLDISSVVIHGETVTVGADKYEFLGTVSQTPTLPANVPVSINANMVKASVTLTVDTQPTSGDKMTIGTKIYTFVPVGTDTADGEVSIGADKAGAQDAIVAAINGTDEFNDPHTLVTAAAFSNDICTITAIAGGTVGNVIASTETFTAVTNIFSAVHLGSGANCSAANAKSAFIAAFNTHDTQGITATSGAGTTIDFTADVAGTAGNSFATTETMANGTFGEGNTTLKGGVNGTVGVKGAMKFDGSYLYLAIDTNTITGKNWRRVSLGAAY